MQESTRRLYWEANTMTQEEKDRLIQILLKNGWREADTREPFHAHRLRAGHNSLVIYRENFGEEERYRVRAQDIKNILFSSVE